MISSNTFLTSWNSNKSLIRDKLLCGCSSHFLKLLCNQHFGWWKLSYTCKIILKFQSDIPTVRECLRTECRLDQVTVCFFATTHTHTHTHSLTHSLTLSLSLSLSLSIYLSIYLRNFQPSTIRFSCQELFRFCLRRNAYETTIALHW